MYHWKKKGKRRRRDNTELWICLISTFELQLFVRLIKHMKDFFSFRSYVANVMSQCRVRLNVSKTVCDIYVTLIEKNDKNFLRGKMRYKILANDPIQPAIFLSHFISEKCVVALFQ